MHNGKFATKVASKKSKTQRKLQEYKKRRTKVMMIDPPIDKLIKHAECRYALTVAVAKRTRELVTSESDYLEKSGLKPISLACKEIYEDKIKIVRD